MGLLGIKRAFELLLFIKYVSLYIKIVLWWLYILKYLRGLRKRRHRTWVICDCFLFHDTLKQVSCIVAFVWCMQYVCIACNCRLFCNV